MGESVTPRYPAEWDPQATVWLAWPHNPQNWLHRRQAIEDFYVRLIDWITHFQPVCLLVPPERMIPEPAILHWKQNRNPVLLHYIRTNDIWIRDYGPFFMQGSGGEFQIKFAFNAWGAKFPPWDADDEVPLQLARLFGQTLRTYSPILEGGAMEFNGQGLAMTTHDCLVGPNRNPVEQQDNLENMLRLVFGLQDLLILPHGLAGDHTDGHIDNVARFLAPNHVVMCHCDDPSSPNCAILQENRELIRSWLADNFSQWTLNELPMPPQRILNGETLPASYMNFIYVNGGMLIPTYDCPTDEEALAFFSRVYPDRVVAGFDCRLVIEEGGSLHCLSKHQSVLN